ncbi:hypothetical protein DPEC_G00328660 [Dallia pectoralis]|nr:hypothetical protein DPEC_G00328660 [Dallia pectoralis]
MLSPTKGFVEKHHVLVARVVVQAQRSTNVPIRIFNPGALPVTLKRGVVAGILQPATVLKKMDPEPFLAPPGLNLPTLPVLLYLVTCRSCITTAVVVCPGATRRVWRACYGLTVTSFPLGPLILVVRGSCNMISSPPRVRR